MFSVDKDESKNIKGCTYISCDLNKELPNIPWGKVDTIILLDVIEHLNNPEDFLEKLRFALRGNQKARLIVSSGNVCFFITRLMVLLGEFNYGPRGTLDITHTRLFTISSLKDFLNMLAIKFKLQNIFLVPTLWLLGLM